MSEGQHEADRDRCWNCGKRGAAGADGRMTCPRCEVTWMPWWSTARGDPNHVCWMGKVLDCVDFTKPQALGAPA